MIYKPSNFSPNLEEVDISSGVNNVFSRYEPFAANLQK